MILGSLAVAIVYAVVLGVLARRLGMARQEIRGLRDQVKVEEAQRVLDIDRVTRAQDDMAKMLSDLNIRCAQNTAAIEHQPDVAQIIAAATGPLVDMQRPRALDQAAGQQQPDPADPDEPEWDPTWDHYDPTDAEFPLPRMPDDYTPPQIPGVELPQWPG